MMGRAPGDTSGDRYGGSPQKERNLWCEYQGVQEGIPDCSSHTCIPLQSSAPLPFPGIARGILADP